MNFINLLGRPGDRISTCGYTTHQAGGQVGGIDVLQVTDYVDGTYNVTLLQTGGAGFHTQLRGNLDIYHYSGNPCPSLIGEPNVDLAWWQLATLSQQDTSTGIYEYPPMVISAYATFVALVLMFTAFALARRIIRHVDSEEDDDSNVIEYEGRDGRTYVKLKRRFREERY